VVLVQNDGTVARLEQVAGHAQAHVDHRAIASMRLAERSPERLGAIGNEDQMNMIGHLRVCAPAKVARVGERLRDSSGPAGGQRREGRLLQEVAHQNILAGSQRVHIDAVAEERMRHGHRRHRRLAGGSRLHNHADVAG
jgi:hypothetical protein